MQGSADALCLSISILGKSINYKEHLQDSWGLQGSTPGNLLRIPQDSLASQLGWLAYGLAGLASLGLAVLA